MKHPSGCVHHVCIECLRTLFGAEGNENYVPLNPRDFGLVIECDCAYCEEGMYPCEEEADRLAEKFPTLWREYDDAENMHLDREETRLASLQSDHCPMCRAHLLDNPKLTWYR